MTTLQDVILNSWARRNGYGIFAELDDLDPCATTDDEAGAAESVGCAFGSGTIEDDETTQRDPIKECQKVSAEYHERMKAAGLE